jgi:hypothetical protein
MATSSHAPGPRRPARLRVLLTTFLHRWLVPLIFLATSLLTAGYGWHLFPAPNMLSPASALGITVYQTEDNNDVSLRVTPRGEHEYEVALTLTSPDTPRPEAPRTPRTRIVFPAASVVDGCEVKCVREGLPMEHVPPTQERLAHWAATQTYTVTTPGAVLLAAGPKAAEGALPQVWGTRQLSTIEVQMDMRDADRFAWTEGPPPNTIDDGRVRWVLDIGTARAAAQPVAAVDRAEESREVRRTFVAGVLLGISGGALIAALQEFLNTRRSTSATASGAGPTAA